MVPVTHNHEWHRCIVWPCMHSVDVGKQLALNITVSFDHRSNQEKARNDHVTLTLKQGLEAAGPLMSICVSLPRPHTSLTTFPKLYGCAATFATVCIIWSCNTGWKCNDFCKLVYACVACCFHRQKPSCLFLCTSNYFPFHLLSCVYFRVSLPDWKPRKLWLYTA